MKILIIIAALFSTSIFGATLTPVQLLNPQGSTNGQVIVSTGASTAPTWGDAGTSSISANSLNANFTGSTAVPVVFTMPSCSGTNQALNYVEGSGPSCVTISAGTGTVSSVQVSGASTGLTFSGGPITTSGTITMGGELAQAYGGTGTTTGTGTGSVVLSTSPTLVTPTITSSLNLGSSSTVLELNGSPGTGGQVLTSAGAGAVPTWQTVTGTGTVTSVAVSGGTTGLTTSGGPITGSGTITIAGTLAQANGGTGQTTKAAAFNALSPITTTGDLIYGSATNTSSRLGIGSTGQVLTVAGGVPTWATGGGGGSSIVNGYINGFTLSNDGTTPNSVLDEAAGYAADSANAAMITGTAYKKSTAGSWVFGNDQNGMGTGLTIAASTWYHVFAIINDGSYDVYFDTSTSAAHAPAGTTSYRYIGDFETDSSSHIRGFIQDGNHVYYTSQVNDISFGGTTSASLITLTIPLGIATYPIITVGSDSSGSVWSPATGATATYSNISNNVTYSDFLSNTSSQLYFISSSGSDITEYTSGYINPHLAPNF